MTYALIDNATLTAVQRLSGVAPTKSNDSTDIDIVALENYVQAILFYDEIIAVDDYIDAYRKERKDGFPEIRFLGKSEFNLDRIADIADAKATEIQPKIQGGEFANAEFRRLIELLQTHIVCTWDISSSVYHLTLKSLSNTTEDCKRSTNPILHAFA